MTTCRYCVAHKSYVGILVNLRTVVIASVCCIWDSFCGPVVLQLVGCCRYFVCVARLPLFCMCTLPITDSQSLIGPTTEITVSF